MLRAGQRPTIEGDDLFSVGCESLVRDVNRNSQLSLAFLLRNAKTLMIQSINSERAHWNKRKDWAELMERDGDE
jgi:hypothetical protein